MEIPINIIACSEQDSWKTDQMARPFYLAVMGMRGIFFDATIKFLNIMKVSYGLIK
jgi:hypothetical protein